MGLLPQRFASWLSRKTGSFESRSNAFSDTLKGKNLFSLIQSYFDNSSGKNLVGDSAMRVAAVHACVEIRSDAVSMLPINIIRYNNANGQSSIAYDHPMYRLIHNRPNPWMTATQFWKLVIKWMDLDGECFGVIVRGSSPRIDLYRGDDGDVFEAGGIPFYNIKGQRYDYSDVLHFKRYSQNGKRGYSIVTEHRESIGSLKMLNEYGNRSLNVIPPVYIKMPQGVNIQLTGAESVKSKLKAQSNDFFSDGTLPILPGGLSLETVGLKPVDAAYLDQVNAKKEDIFMIFRVPPALANAYRSGVTFNNLEQQNLQFLIYTLSPMLKNIEEELNEKLFTTREQATLAVKFNVNALLRTDLKTRYEWFSAMFKLGVYSRNEIREIEDLNPIAGGDKYYIEGNNMTEIAGDGSIIREQPAQAQRKKLSERAKEKLKEHFNGSTEELIDFLER